MGKVVGILSMQRVLNYGSFLQAYALKQLLLQNGADDVYFIDIEKGRSLAGFEQENSLLKSYFVPLFCSFKVSYLQRLET